MPRRFFLPQDRPLQGRHLAYRHRVEGRYHFQSYSGSINAEQRFAAYRDLTAELQQIIAEAVTNGHELRVQGSEWSLSHVGLAENRLINSKLIRLLRLPVDGHVVPGYQGVEKLRFFECGESISVVNKVLFRDRLSLKASGSNDGQTLAGALSTGTHGSAFAFGAIPNFVVGLHVVAGPTKHVYVQRASQPVVTQSFADKLGAQFVEDDELFNAALVSFGCYGIIQGALIETRDVFPLHATRFYHPFNDGLKRAATDLDFSGIDLSLSKLPASAPRDRPYHFQLFFNPNEANRPTRASVLMMFEDDWSEHEHTYTPPPWDDGRPGPGAAGLDIIGDVFNLLPGSWTRDMFNTELEEQFRPFYVLSTLGDMFRGEKNQGKLQVTGTAFPRSRVLDVLEIVFQTYQDFAADKGSILPLIVSCRFVKGTSALLGFTRFDDTCTLELDTIYTPNSAKFLKDVRRNIDAADIPFTVHWGKLDSYLTANRLKRLYGNDLERWLARRRTLLENDAVCNVFTNKFMRRLGLDRIV